MGGVADFDLSGTENCNRKNFFVIEALDVRARDGERLEFDGFLRLTAGWRGGGLSEGRRDEGEGQRGQGGQGGRSAVVGHGGQG